MQGPLENVYKAALALGTANQLTNILRDVGEDVNERNRIYVPLEELDRFGIREADVRRRWETRPKPLDTLLCSLPLLSHLLLKETNRFGISTAEIRESLPVVLPLSALHRHAQNTAQVVVIDLLVVSC